MYNHACCSLEIKGFLTVISKHPINNKSIILLCFTGFISRRICFYSSSLIEFLRIKFQLTSWQIGIAQSAVPLGAIVGAMVAGRFADMFGRNHILLWNFLILFISGVLGAFIFDFYALCISRLVNGFCGDSLSSFSSLFNRDDTG